MADSKISALPAGIFAATDEVPVNKGGTTTKVTLPLVSMTPLDQSGWAWLNQGGATVAQGGGVVSLYKPASDTGTHVRGRIVAVPSTPWTMTMAYVPVLPATFSTAGFILYDGTKCYVLALGCSTPVTATLIQTYQYSNVSTNTSAASVACPPSFLQSPIYMSLTDDGTNNVFKVSMNGGRTYRTFLTEAHGAFLTATHVGLALDGPGTASIPVGMEVLSWVQS